MQTVTDRVTSAGRAAPQTSSRVFEFSGRIALFSRGIRKGGVSPIRHEVQTV
jgi:hypothetical protein